MRGLAKTAVLLLATIPVCLAIEVSTGYLIGPKYDSRAIYVRSNDGGQWRKVNAGGYRKASVGKVLGARRRAGGDTPPAGATMIRVPLQSESDNSFTPLGALDMAKARQLSALISSAARSGLIIELGVFHPAQDQVFHSPDFLLDATGAVVDWLVEAGHRNVIINFAPDWKQTGWDFDHWVPLHLEQLADSARARFQMRRADFTSPIAITVGHRAGEQSGLIQAADVVELAGAALQMDTRKIERPVLAVGSEACRHELSRTSGCVLDSPDAPGPLLRLFFDTPPAGSVGQ
jgi:hypothetical protein